MPFGGIFRLSQEIEEFGDPGIGFFVFTLHHPQAGPADNGVLRRTLHVGVVRHHAYAIVELRILTDIRQRAGGSGGDGAVAVIGLLG